jgi:hypothetical protein
VALSESEIASTKGAVKAQHLHPGSFKWMDAGQAPYIAKNDRDAEVRFLVFVVRGQAGTKSNNPR